MVHHAAPRRLVKTTGFADLSTVVFKGMKWKEKIPFPIAMAPVGVLMIFNPDGETAVAMAAAKEKVPHILSTASSTSIENVVKANGEGGMRWHRLYRPCREHDDITISLLQRAKKVGVYSPFL
jgi:lactate 2-monooxygenase